MSLRSSRLVLAGALVSALVSAAFLTGCPDPAGSFDEFGVRYAKIHGSTAASVTSGGEGGGCAADPGKLDGTFLFALSAGLSPKKPVLFSMALTTTAGDPDGLEMNLKATPLDGMDHMTPVDAEVDLGTSHVDPSGAFVATLGTIVVNGAANTITPGSPITAENVVLTGSLCATDPDFLCGTVTGMVTDPLMLDLKGSTFTMQRYTDTIPAPVINCAKDPAKY